MQLNAVAIIKCTKEVQSAYIVHHDLNRGDHNRNHHLTFNNKEVKKYGNRK